MALLQPRASDLPTRSAEDEEVVELFERNSSWWRDVYAEDSVDGAVYRRREQLAFEWLDGLRLELPALDAGCGAGRVARHLAATGRVVVGFDPSEEMLRIARKGTAGNGPGTQTTLATFFLGEVGKLPLGEGQCPVVVGLGLIPWLSGPEASLRELARVAGPNGYLLVTSDNAGRLSEPLDSRRLIPPSVHRALRRLILGDRAAAAVDEHRYRPSEFRGMLVAAGCQPVRETTVGFGPVKFFGRRVVPDSAGRRLDALLQRLADRGWFGLQWRGNHHVILAEVRSAS